MRNVWYWLSPAINEESGEELVHFLLRELGAVYHTNECETRSSQLGCRRLVSPGMSCDDWSTQNEPTVIVHLYYCNYEEPFD
jgi:hypothetical protein